jgi:hypothetical protein
VRHLGLETQWLAFKNKRLLAELEQVIARHGVVSPTRLESPPRAERISRLRQSAEARPRFFDDEAVRKIILKIVGDMPLAELRSLRLPVGDVVDAITKER